MFRTRQAERRSRGPRRGAVASLAVFGLVGGVFLAALAHPPWASAASPPRPVGEPLLIDVPAAAGRFLDVDPLRAGTQVLALALHEAGAHRVRLVSVFDLKVLAESADGGITPRDTLGAGWRGFVWGHDASGRVRLWTPAFDSSRSLASVDPTLPCGSATSATTPLAGPFAVTIPAGAKPGGKVVPSPTSAFVFGDPANAHRGVRIASAGGVDLGLTKTGANVAQGGFAFGGAVFAYGTRGGKPALWTPVLLGKSSDLVAGAFVGCTGTESPRGTITLTKHLLPAADPGRFDLKVDAVTRAAAAGDGGTSGSVSVPVGDHAVSETAVSPASLTGYTSAIECSEDSNPASPLNAPEAGPLSVPVAEGDAWRCTLTNTRIPPDVRIVSIDPSPARYGQSVTITGSGFGGAGLQVDVGGAPAQVQGATDASATFVVPSNAPSGDTTVHATSAAGKTGSIGVNVVYDGVVAPLLFGTASHATIGRGGGSLEGGGIHLEIPAGALSDDVEITLTPMTGLRGSPLDDSFIGGAKLEPEGIAFLKPARLTIPLPASVHPEDVLGFGSSGDGADLHLVPRTVAGGQIVLDLWHFSTGGASSGGAGAAATMQTHQPSTAEQQAQQQIAASQQACEAELAQAIADGPACAKFQQDLTRALFTWYVDAVKPALQNAAGAPSFEVEAALNEWLRWAGTVEDSPPPAPDSLRNEINQAHALASAAVADLARRRLANCTGTDLTSQLRDVGRVADYVIAGDVDLAGQGLPAVEDLAHACAHLKIEVTKFPPIAALLYGNTLQGRVTVDVFSGPDRTDIPFTLKVGDDLVGTGADGSFEKAITPTSSPLDVELVAQASASRLQNSDFTASERLARPARERIKLVPLTPVDPLDAGATATIHVLVAGDDMAGANVTLDASSGSTSSSSIVVDDQGEGTFTYTAPSDGTTEASVRASFADATSTLLIPIRLLVSPASATIAPGGSQQFTANMANPTNTAVTWSASGGSISNTGLYVAGPTSGTFAVTATSVAQPERVASATVHVVAQSGRVVVSSPLGLVEGYVITLGVNSPDNATAKKTWPPAGTTSGDFELISIIDGATASPPPPATPTISAHGRAVPTLFGSLQVITDVGFQAQGGGDVLCQYNRSGGGTGQAHGDGLFTVSFTVLDASVPYSATHTETIDDSGFAVQYPFHAHAYSSLSGPTGTIFVAQTGVGRSGAFSGTLAPGSYSYTAQFSAHCGLPNTPLPESARTTLDYELVVGG